MAAESPNKQKSCGRFDPESALMVNFAEKSHHQTQRQAWPMRASMSTSTDELSIFTSNSITVTS